MFRRIILALAATAALASIATSASAATCPAGDLGFGLITVNTTPASSCIAYGDGNLGQGGGDAVTALGYTLLANTAGTNLYLNITGGPAGTGNFSISPLPAGYDTFVLAIKDGNIGIIDPTPNPDVQFNWGAFLLGALSGTWSITTDGGTFKQLSHALLYGLPCGGGRDCAPPPPGAVPLPGALPLLASALGGIGGLFAWRRKRKLTRQPA